MLHLLYVWASLCRMMDVHSLTLKSCFQIHLLISFSVLCSLVCFGYFSNKIHVKHISHMIHLRIYTYICIIHVISRFHVKCPCVNNNVTYNIIGKIIHLFHMRFLDISYMSHVETRMSHIVRNSNRKIVNVYAHLSLPCQMCFFPFVPGSSWVSWDLSEMRHTWADWAQPAINQTCMILSLSSPGLPIDIHATTHTHTLHLSHRHCTYWPADRHTLFYC